MTKYINADDLYNQIHRDVTVYESAELGIKMDCLIAIKETPAAEDVIQVVRCKDCKFFVHAHEGSVHWCRGLGLHRLSDDYCSRGVRRKTDD